MGGDNSEKKEQLPINLSEAPESKTHKWERQIIELLVWATTTLEEACYAAFSCKYSLY